MYISEWGPYLGYFPYVIEFSQSLILSNYLYFCSQLIWVSDVEAVMCKQGRSQQFRTCRSGTGFKIKTYFQERQRFLRPKIIKNSYLIQYVVITSLQKDQATNVRFISYSNCSNCRRTLDVYLLFAIWMEQRQSNLIYIFVNYGQFVSYKSVILY